MFSWPIVDTNGVRKEKKLKGEEFGKKRIWKKRATVFLSIKPWTFHGTIHFTGKINLNKNGVGMKCFPANLIIIKII